MKRSNFFKALATVIFAPSILKGINWEGKKDGIKMEYGEINRLKLEFRDDRTVKANDLAKKINFKCRYECKDDKWFLIRQYTYNK